MKIREVVCSRRHQVLVIVMSTILLVIWTLLNGCTSVFYKLGILECGPVYGNWCGENYPLAGNDPAPVDSWDRACRAHDRCYEEGKKSRDSCDSAFIRELSRLSRTRLAPQRMHNAYSYFQRDGRIDGWIQFVDEVWGFSASCKGGDGEGAQFFCQSNFAVCPLNPDMGPGRAGFPCICRGLPGLIVER